MTGEAKDWPLAVLIVHFGPGPGTRPSLAAVEAESATTLAPVSISMGTGMPSMNACAAYWPRASALDHGLSVAGGLALSWLRGPRLNGRGGRRRRSGASDPVIRNGANPGAMAASARTPIDNVTPPFTIAGLCARHDHGATPALLDAAGQESLKQNARM